MSPPISLSDIRAAIHKSRRMSFTYLHEKMVADFYFLGHARKTGSYVILAWCIEPEEEWQILRYSLLRDLEPIGSIDSFRSDFDPRHPQILSIDTQAYSVTRRHH